MPRMERDGGYGDKTDGLNGRLLWLGYHAGDLANDVALVEIRIKLATGEGDEHMAIVKAFVDGVKAVGFITAPGLDTLVHLVEAKLRNGSMKWREDKPYGT